MFNLKLKKNKNFIDMIGLIIHQWDMNFSWKLKNDELFIFDEPTNYMKPISNIDSKKWLEAMKSKTDSMYWWGIDLSWST
jgi:hypothetical protein